MSSFEPSVVKKKARSRLYADLPTHIAAPLCVAVCVLGVLFAGSAVLSLTDMYRPMDMFLYNLFELIILAVALLLTVPLLYGLYVYFYRSAVGKEARLTDLFRAFGSSSLFARSFCLFWAMLWRFVPYFAFPLFCLWETDAYRGGRSLFVQTSVIRGGIDLTGLELCVLCCLSATIAFSLYARHFCAVCLVITHEDAPVSACFAAGSFAVRCSASGIHFMSLIGSFLPLIFASLLTFGILFVLYSLPYILLSLFTLSATLCRDEIQMLNADYFFQKHR